MVDDRLDFGMIIKMDNFDIDSVKVHEDRNLALQANDFIHLAVHHY